MSANLPGLPRNSDNVLENQLFRYAEDLHQLMNEHDALLERFRALETAHREVAARPDEAELHAAERRLSHLAYYDVLTGLPNRQLFNDRFRMALSQTRRDGSRLGLFFLDLDHFKEVNDTLGHEVGDELLKEVACRLSGAVREADTVARLGGDEFTILLPGLKEGEDAHTVAEKIIQAFELPFRLGEHYLFSSPSIGIAVYPDHGDDTESLIRHADKAMYIVKAQGGNGYHRYNPREDGEQTPSTLHGDLRYAIERGELVLHYQPQISATDQRLVSVEALVRWHHPELGNILPEDFIPVAERTGMIIDIGRWVLETACRQLVQWRLAGLDDLRVSVNISPRQLRAPNFTDNVLKALQRSGLPAHALELEISERELLLYPGATAEKLGPLRARGVRITLDDFAMSYAMLLRLEQFPVDRIKMDKKLSRTLDEDAHAQRLSTCIMTLAKVMELEIIAQGVETDLQRQHFVAHGCDALQGYLVDPPLSPDAIPSWQTLFDQR